MSEQTKGHKNLIESIVDTQLDERDMSKYKRATKVSLLKMKSGEREQKKQRENTRREKAHSFNQKQKAEKEATAKATERAGRRKAAVSARNKSRGGVLRKLRTVVRGQKSRIQNAKSNPRYVSSDYDPLLNYAEDLLSMEHTLQQRRKQVEGDHTIIKHYNRQLDNIYSQMEDVIDDYDFDAVLDEANEEDLDEGRGDKNVIVRVKRAYKKATRTPLGKLPTDGKYDRPYTKKFAKKKYRYYDTSTDGSDPSYKEDLNFDAFIDTLSEEEIKYLDELSEEEFTEFFNQLEEENRKHSSAEKKNNLSDRDAHMNAASVRKLRYRIRPTEKNYKKWQKAGYKSWLNR